MNNYIDHLVHRTRIAIAAVCILGCASLSLAQNAPIVQPGAIGDAPRELSAEEAIKVAKTGYSPADVTFMQDMIPHHNQAVQMAALVADRTNRQEACRYCRANRCLAGRRDRIHGAVVACAR